MFWMILYIISALLTAIFLTILAVKDGAQFGEALIVFGISLILTPIALIFGIVYLTKEY